MLPFGAVMNLDASALAYVAYAPFVLTYVFGVPVSWTLLLAALPAVVLFTIAAPGLPAGMGTSLWSATLFASMLGLEEPLQSEFVATWIALSSGVPDMLRTATNCTGGRLHGHLHGSLLRPRQRWRSHSNHRDYDMTSGSAGAHKLVRVNGRVRSGERVVVVTDYTMRDIAELVIIEAREAGAEVTTCVMPMREHDGQEPPAPVAAAMREANVIFSPVRFSITHTRAMRAALESGARAILMTAYTDDMLECPALIDTDFEAQVDLCRRIGQAFTDGSFVRLTSPKGTELSFSIEGRKANVLTNIPEPGQLAPVPDIEVNVVPVTGSAEGRLIADARETLNKTGVVSWYETTGEL